MTPYFTSDHQSWSCKGACTDVIRIETQNDFCCFTLCDVWALTLFVKLYSFLH